MKDHHLIAILAAALFTLCLTGILRASIIVTETPGKHVLQSAQGTKEFDTHEACAAAAQQEFSGTQVSEESTCSAQTKITVTGVCDAPRPTIPNAEQELVAVQDAMDDTKWWNWERAYVPTDYPVCWKKGWMLETHPLDGPAPDPGEFWVPPQ